MNIPFRTKKEKHKDCANNVKLVVSGSSSPERLKELEEQLEKKGVKAVVTKEPILGVFDL